MNKKKRRRCQQASALLTVLEGEIRKITAEELKRRLEQERLALRGMRASRCGNHVCGDPLKVALPCESGYNISREQENRVSSGRCLVGTFSMPDGRSSCRRTLDGVSTEAL